MSVPISITDLDYLEAARQFLLLILPAGTEVVQGQNNRVGEPVADNYVVLTAMDQLRLATNTVTYQAGPMPTEAFIKGPMQMGLQADIHGPLSATLTMLIAIAWRDGYAVSNTDGGTIVPLFADEPHQMPFDNGEGQYESRWVMNIFLQANPVLTIPQDYADALDIQLYEADQ